MTSSQLRDQYSEQQKMQEQQATYQHKIMMEEELRIFRRNQLVKRQTQQKEMLFEVLHLTLFFNLNYFKTIIFFLVFYDLTGAFLHVKIMNLFIFRS